MDPPSECVAATVDPGGVESDGSTALGEGIGEDSPATPGLQPPPGFQRPRTSPVGQGKRAPRGWPRRDATPKSCSGQTPASSSDARPSSAQSTPVCAPPGLARPEQMLWSPFLGDLDAESRSVYTPASASVEAPPPLPLDEAEPGGAWELPFLLGPFSRHKYTPGETLRKTSWMGTASMMEELSLPQQGSPRLALQEGGEEAVVGQMTISQQIGDERHGAMQLGTEEMPTVGSAGHHLRACKPCAFVNTKGCKDGIMCQFCHLCAPGEKKRRKKEKKAFQRAVNQWHRGGGASVPWEPANLQPYT